MDVLGFLSFFFFWNMNYYYKWKLCNNDYNNNLFRISWIWNIIFEIQNIILEFRLLYFGNFPKFQNHILIWKVYHFAQGKQYNSELFVYGKFNIWEYYQNNISTYFVIKEMKNQGNIAFWYKWQVFIFLIIKKGLEPAPAMAVRGSRHRHRLLGFVGGHGVLPAVSGDQTEAAKLPQIQQIF